MAFFWAILEEFLAKKFNFFPFKKLLFSKI